ncbi:reverse transcriptase domain-containing protein [Tanacetum coccineum]
MIGFTLTEEGRNKLCNLLQRNLDIYSWKPVDMTDILRYIAEHRLNMREGCSQIRQKKRGQAADRIQAIQEESRTEDEIVRDVEERFKTLREINGKLNPKKCTFGIEEEMFLGYKVSTRGLKVCPDKVDAVLSLSSPKCLKDVQKLNGKLINLNMFLAKSAEKSLPLFKTLKKCTTKSNFHWTTEAEEAFKQMKQLIAELLMLVAPMEKEKLIVYLAAAKETVCTVLMTERETKKMPIYFVRRALRGPEINYTSMEKLVLALVHASKRLKRYFQEHPIIVITDQPIQQVLSRLEVAERLQKWSIKLGEYVMHYRPRVSVKGKILAYFIVERREEDSPDTLMEMEEELPNPWILFMDRSSCTDGSEARLILTNPEGTEFTYALRFRFDATNNEALISVLRIAEQMGVKALTNGFKAFSIRQIPRSENRKADALSKIASTSFAHLSKQVLVEELKIYKPVPKNLQQKLTPITSSWPFYKWGIDIAGPISRGAMESQILNSSHGLLHKMYSLLGEIISENIVCRFGLLGEIISENNSVIIHSKIGVKNYVFANILLLLNTHKLMAW